MYSYQDKQQSTAAAGQAFDDDFQLYNNIKKKQGTEEDKLTSILKRIGVPDDYTEWSRKERDDLAGALEVAYEKAQSYLAGGDERKTNFFYPEKSQRLNVTVIRTQDGSAVQIHVIAKKGKEDVIANVFTTTIYKPSDGETPVPTQERQPAIEGGETPAVEINSAPAQEKETTPATAEEKEEPQRFTAESIDQLYEGLNVYEEYDPFAGLSEDFGQNIRTNTPDYAMRFPGDRRFENPILRGNSQLEHTMNRNNPRNPDAQKHGHYLGEGYCGDDVIALRQAMVAMYPELEGCFDVCSTCFDKELLEAYQRFQRDYCLDGTNGVIGPETLKRLDQELMRKNVTTIDWERNDPYGEVRQMSEWETNFYKNVGDIFHRPRNANVKGQFSLGSTLLTQPNYENSDYKTEYDVMPGEPIKVFATSAQHSHDYFYVEVKDRDTGAIRRGWMSGDHIQFRHFDEDNSYTIPVGDNDTLEKIIDREYGELIAQKKVSYEDVAAAIYMTNQDKYVLYLTDKEDPAKRAKEKINPWEEQEELWSRVRVTSGFDIELPRIPAILAMKEANNSYSWTDFIDDLLYAAQGILGFLEGLGEGFVEGAVNFAKDLWSLVESILSGEIVDQAKEFFDAISELSWDDFKELGMALLDSSLEELENAWNNPDPYEKWHFFGKMTGKLLFEVVMSALSGGGALAGKLGKLGKLGKVMGKVTDGKAFRKAMDKVPDNMKRKAGERNLDKKHQQVGDDINTRKNNNPDFNHDADKVLKDPDISARDKKGRDVIKEDDPNRDIDQEASDQMEQPENKKGHDESTRKEKTKALAAAKAIEAADDKADVPVVTLMAHLKPLAHIKGVQYFDKVKLGPGHYAIYMIGSSNLVNEFSNQSVGVMSEQIDAILNKLKNKAKFKLEGTGTYRKVKGHHPTAKKAFSGDVKYDYKEAFSVSPKSLDEVSGVKGIHSKITGQQNKLYSAFAKQGKKLEISDVADIEIKAMTNVGIPEDVATGWVVKSLEDLKSQGVTEITNIPWNGIN